MSIVKPISARRSMVHRLMINPPIIPPQSNLVHKGTAVEISRSTDFTKREEIIVNAKFYKEDNQDILTIKNTIMVSPDEVLYARYAYILGTEAGTEGKDAYIQEKWSRMSSTHGDQVGFKFDDNILATPQITVSDYNNQVGVPQLKVELGGYKVLIGSIGTHKYTTWEFTDTDNNVIYSRVKDEDNLTSILVNKDLFEANRIYFIRAKVYNSFNGESNYGTYIYSTGLSTNVSYKVDILKPLYYGESINIAFEAFTPNITAVKIIIREANGDYEVPVDTFTKSFTVSSSLLIDFEELYNGPKGDILKPEGTYKFYAQLEYTVNGQVTYGSVDYIDTIRITRKELYPNRTDCNYTGNYYSLEDVELGPIVVNSREFKDGTFVLGVNTHKVGLLGDYTNELILYAKYGRQIRSASLHIPLPLQVPAISQGNNNLPIVNILPMYTDMVIVNYATFDLTSKNYKRSVWVLYKVDLVALTFTYVTHEVFEDEYLSTAESSSAVITKNNEVLYIPHGYGTFSKTRKTKKKTRGKETVIPSDTVDSLPAFYSTDLVGLYVTSNFDTLNNAITPSTLPAKESVGQVAVTDPADVNIQFQARPASLSVKDYLSNQTGPNTFDQTMEALNVFQCDGRVSGDKNKLGVIKFYTANLTNLLTEGEKNNGITIDFYYSIGNNILNYLREGVNTPGTYTFEDIEFIRWGTNTVAPSMSMFLDSKKTVEGIYQKAGITFNPNQDGTTITISEGDKAKLSAIRDFQYFTYVTYKNDVITTSTRVDLNGYDRYYGAGRMPVPRVTIVFNLGTSAKRGEIEVYANGESIGKVGQVVDSNVKVISDQYPLVFRGHMQKNNAELKVQPVTVFFNSIRFYVTPHGETRVREGDQTETGILPGTLGVYDFKPLPLMKLTINKDTTGPKIQYRLTRTIVKQVIKQDIMKHMTLVPNRGKGYSDTETYLILGGTSDARYECQNGPGGTNMTGVYYYKLANKDVMEFDPRTSTLNTIGTLPQEMITFDERTASFYNICAQRRFDGKIVLFNNSATSRYTGIAVDTTTWLLDPAKAGAKDFVVNQGNDTSIDFPFRSTIVRNNGDMIRVAYSTTQQCPILCYPADPTIEGVIDTDIANKHLVVKPYQRLAIDNPYAYESISIEGDNLENTGTLTWIDATRIRTFNCFDRIVTRDTTETQAQADAKKKERLYVLDNVKYKVTKE